jgi:hypothetical protein
VKHEVAPEQFAATLFKIADDWKRAGEKIDALSFAENLSPRLSALRDKAKAAHQAGSLDKAEELLAEIMHEEIDALKKLENHEREVQEEIRLRKRGVAETKAVQGAVAHARLNYREAAALYGEAASLAAPFDAKRRKNWLFAQATELYDQGNEFGDNAALADAISVYRQCLDLMPAQARSARLGHDAEQSRYCASEAWRARERHGDAQKGGRSLWRGAEAIDGGSHAVLAQHCAAKSRPSKRVADETAQQMILCTSSKNAWV